MTEALTKTVVTRDPETGQIIKRHNVPLTEAEIAQREWDKKHAVEKKKKKAEQAVANAVRQVETALTDAEFRARLKEVLTDD